MKDLRNFILESTDLQSFKFNLKEFDNAKETVESIENLNLTCLTIDKDELSIKVNVTKNSSTKLETFVDILQQFYETLRHSSKRTNSESYAQKINKFGSKIGELNDAIDSYTDDGSLPQTDTKDTEEDDEEAE